MTGQFKLSPRAQRDIEEIWDFTARRWGLDQAEAYIRRLERIMAQIGDQPLLGQPCDHIRAGYRRFTSEAHILYYRIIGDHVEIIRLLHKAMDFNRHLD